MNFPIPKVVVHSTIGKEQASYGQIELPEKYMDQYKEIVGNALAKVTVSADMAIKDFGTGVGTMVSVTLSCNQDQETIERAIDLGGQIARGYCEEQYNLAEKELLQKKQGNNAKAPY